MPSYGYARVWANLRGKAVAKGRPPVNRKRIYRVMKATDCCSNVIPAAVSGVTRGGSRLIAPTCVGVRTASRSAATMPKKMRVAFALGCCDRETVGHIATTEGIKGEDCR
jgi:putative transposase